MLKPSDKRYFIYKTCVLIYYNLLLKQHFTKETEKVSVVIQNAMFPVLTNNYVS